MLIGQTIFQYKILEKLGEGGMGVVYKAHDTKLDRPAALKFLPLHLSASEQDKARFIQEAKTASAMSHPNICTIYSIDEHEGQLFIAMEFVDGVTLRERQGSVNARQAIEIGIQIADGLAAAHEKGIVHRDIKPENIMVRKDGIAQIMDFGLAKLSGASRLTKAGSTVGTAGYMSPEQVQGLETDQRTDIFSLGVILYELFAGRSPFTNAHEAAINYEIVNVDPPPISLVKPDIDAELEAIVFDCLAKEPAERFQTAAEVSRNLRRMKKASSRTRLSGSRAVSSPYGGTPGHLRGQRSGRKIPGLTTGVALIGGLLIGLGVMRWILPTGASDPAQPSTKIRASINLPPDAPLILGYDLPTIGFNSPAIAVSPQGRWLSYVARTASGRMLYLVDISNGTFRLLPGTEGAVHPFFSPDGEWIGFLTYNGVKKVPRRGGAAVSLCEATSPVLAWWGRSGTIYFTENQNSSLSRVSMDGSKRETVLSTTSFGRFRGGMLPDEGHILTVKPSSISDDYNEISLTDIGTGETKTLIRSGYAPRYVHPGYIVFAHAGNLMAVRFDTTSRDVVGEPVTVATGVTMESLFGILQASASDNGMLTFVPGSDISVGKPAWVDHRGQIEYIDEMPEQVYGELDLAPDDSRIAVHVAAVKDYVWIWDLRRAEGRRIPSPIAEGWPMWSPGGGRIATRTSNSDSFVIHDITPEGAFRNRVTMKSGGFFRGWKPDDEFFTNPFQKQSGPAGSDSLVSPPPPRFGVFFITISPDGRFLSYKSDETGAEEVFLRSYPDGKVLGQVSTGGGTEPIWLPSGRLFYRNGHRWYSTRVTSTPEPKWDSPRLFLDTDFVDTPGWSYDVASDGQRLLMVKRKKPITSSRIDLLTNWSAAFGD